MTKGESLESVFMEVVSNAETNSETDSSAAV